MACMPTQAHEAPVLHLLQVFRRWLLHLHTALLTRVMLREQMGAVAIELEVGA